MNIIYSAWYFIFVKKDLDECLKDKESTITELYNEIASKVSGIAEQTPTMGRLPGDMGGEIYIGL